ncbi:helix-turn-helix domain-containing protein [Paenibacillus sp. 453mf]|uniref:helix-turn-helix domain-containing protein n=1 Tax=Paenibacillus sp. 453mf TaxID=1761874 RepID=UPI000B805F07|nr:helix-turn-helix domain-containing protein [Paenibacillus sp. 453mf]
MATYENSKLEIIWGNRLLDEGFTSLPNLLVRNYRRLGIQHGEFGFITVLLSYKHDARDPFPSRKTLADNLDCSEKQIDKWIKALKGVPPTKCGFCTLSPV